MISLLFMLSVDTAEACRCKRAPDAASAMAATTHVFTGTVTSKDPIDHQLRVGFDVQRSFKGVSDQKLSLLTSRSGASCGYSFEVGKKYLVYAQENKNGISVSLCSRTMAEEQASEDIAAFEAAGMGIDTLAAPKPAVDALNGAKAGAEAAKADIEAAADGAQPAAEVAVEKAVADVVETPSEVDAEVAGERRCSTVPGSGVGLLPLWLLLGRRRRG